MNFEFFFARRISFQTQRSASALVVRLAILSIALAVATMEIALSFVQGFETEIENKVAGFSGHILVTNYAQEIKSELLPITYKQEEVATILAIPEVSSVSPYIEHTALMVSSDYWDGVRLKGVDSSYHWQFLAKALIEGTLPNYQTAEASKEILISRKIARKLNLNLGDSPKLIVLQENDITQKRVTVVGIYETGLEEFDNTIVIADLRMLRDLWSWEDDQIAGYEVNTWFLDKNMDYYVDASSFPFFHKDSLSKIDYTSLDVSAVSPNFLATPVTYSFQEIFDWLMLQHQNVWVILILMMIVAVINMTTVLLIIIIERTRTVGILKSMGMEGGKIRRMFVFYALLLILVGVVLGNLLGLGLLASQDKWEWLKVNQEDYFITTVPVAWVWMRFFLVNLGVVVICTLAMYLPSILVQRITPVKAIRFS
ncbi:MAG: ABC transporter permease [Bacteroidia bacterium]|nr:ABC transporter permease [Bacteroidia bacterium]